MDTETIIWNHSGVHIHFEINYTTGDCEYAIDPTDEQHADPSRISDAHNAADCWLSGFFAAADRHNAFGEQ